MGLSSEMPLLMSFALSMALISSFPPRVFLNRMECGTKVPHSS
jgi:hypothetical protein